jgi:hypothetical protein
MAPHAHTPGAHHRRDPELRRAFARSSAVLLRDIAGAVDVDPGGEGGYSAWDEEWLKMSIQGDLFEIQGASSLSSRPRPRSFATSARAWSRTTPSRYTTPPTSPTSWASTSPTSPPRHSSGGFAQWRSSRAPSSTSGTPTSRSRINVQDIQEAQDEARQGLQRPAQPARRGRPARASGTSTLATDSWCGSFERGPRLQHLQPPNSDRTGSSCMHTAIDRVRTNEHRQRACHFPTKADWPVIAMPTISELISRVPS